MPRSATLEPGEIAKAYAEYDRQVTISNFKVACLLGFVLMPAGFILDRFVYPQQVWYFFQLRLLCSLLIAVFYGLLQTQLGRKYYRFQGVTLFMLPAGFITWMIYSTEGAASPYYAGLNLVLLVLAFVLHWTFRESLAAVVLVTLMYVVACHAHGSVGGSGNWGNYVNNLYFLSLTGIIVATGSYFHSQSRYREFALRYELDRNKQVLEEANQKLLELDQAKSRFFANISHELRTPLTLMLSPLEAVLHRHGRSLDDETKGMLVTMHSNGLRLLKLINDLLDLVRLESGRMEVKRDALAIEEFVRGLASAARQVADNKGIRLTTDVHGGVGCVLTDRDKLERIVLNLMFNAIKFTPAGGRVELNVQREDRSLVLKVADTGIGISRKNLANVFGRFWQADGSSVRKQQGTGIGLALVKELVEVQGGKVIVDSEEGKGTTFTVRLPYEAATEAPVAVSTESVPKETTGSEEWLVNLYRRAELFPALAPAQQTEAPAEAAPGNRPVALVADDEPDMLRYLVSQLQSHYVVVQAQDGLEAVDKAAKARPDIVLLDMMMPGKDGLQVCRELRAQENTENVPIIMLTARADEETKLNALSAGASDFLAKPFSTTELHVRLTNLVESYGYQRKLAAQNRVLEETIDQLKSTESQLVQSEKLASLGRLSAGIIHEINNPLNFASTGLYTLRKRARALPDERQAEFSAVLDNVEEGLTRVKDIVSDLRLFTHQGKDAMDHVAVTETVQAALRFLSNEWKDKVRVNIEMPETQAIWGNRNKLIHLFVNLLQNAIEAVRTKTFAEGGPAIHVAGRVEGGKSVVRIRDNGCGIAAEHINKIFDPFFTTKDVGEGMGLGLSICHRLVQDYEGRITVRSEPDQFTEFTLEFPLKGEPDDA